MKLLKLLNSSILGVKIFVFFCTAIPGIGLLHDYQSNQLGINGLETLLRTSGFTALVLFILTLSVTPLRRLLSYGMGFTAFKYGKRLSDWNWMIRIRRMLGVFSFLYAALHFYIYSYFELDMDITELLFEIQDRPFILAGSIALIVLVPLFLTSTDCAMRLLKKNWRRIHRLMYPAAILIAFHYFLQAKPGVYDSYPYLLIIFSLILFRILDCFKIILKRNDTGMVSKDR